MAEKMGHPKVSAVVIELLQFFSSWGSSHSQAQQAGLEADYGRTESPVVFVAKL